MKLEPVQEATPAESTPVEVTPIGAMPIEVVRAEESYGDASPMEEVYLEASPTEETSEEEMPDAFDRATLIERDNRSESRAESCAG